MPYSYNRRKYRKGNRHAAAAGRSVRIVHSVVLAELLHCSLLTVSGIQHDARQRCLPRTRTVLKEESDRRLSDRRGVMSAQMG